MHWTGIEIFPCARYLEHKSLIAIEWLPSLSPLACHRRVNTLTFETTLILKDWQFWPSYMAKKAILHRATSPSHKHPHPHTTQSNQCFFLVVHKSQWANVSETCFALSTLMSALSFLHFCVSLSRFCSASLSLLPIVSVFYYIIHFYSLIEKMSIWWVAESECRQRALFKDISSTFGAVAMKN